MNITTAFTKSPAWRTWGLGLMFYRTTAWSKPDYKDLEPSYVFQFRLLRWYMEVRFIMAIKR